MLALVVIAPKFGVSKAVDAGNDELGAVRLDVIPPGLVIIWSYQHNNLLANGS